MDTLLAVGRPSPLTIASDPALDAGRMSRPLLHVPAWELARTPVGRRIGALAARSGLFLHHFEHRVHLAPPEHWVPESRPELGAPATWQNGVLADAKAQHFRLDAMVGSFHPGHRSQWAVHELCHRLVGFAWRASGTPLYHTLAARLAELLPTSVWFFFEEAWLRRCEGHAGQGPLFGLGCEACARAGRVAVRSVSNPDAPPDPEGEAAREPKMAAGLRFMERELAAVARSRRTGRCEPNGWATVNLATDALAYTAANLERLHAPEMGEFIEKFFRPEQGWHATLDALEARVLAVRSALLEGAELPVWAATPETWARQDVAWRLMMVRAECDPDDAAHEGLCRLIDALADGASFAETFAGYRDVHRDFVLPEPEDVFAVGFDLGAEGVPDRSVRQVTEGLETVLPNTLALLEADESPVVVSEFLAQDLEDRAPLARRFAGYLRETRPGPVADLATYEAAIAHPLPPDPESATLGVAGARDKRRRRSSSFEILRFGCDVLSLAQALDAEPGDDPGTPEDESAADLVTRPTCLVVGRPAHGELIISDITQATADALEAMGEQCVEPASVGLAKGEAAALEAVGVLVPAAWKCD